MNVRTFRRASVLAVAALLATAAVAFADTVPADGNDALAGDQLLIDLGQKVAGDTVDWNVMFNLTCASTAHTDEGQTITLDATSFTVPLDGDAVATSTTVGPIPASWADDGQWCPSPAPRLPSNGPSIVSLTMPTTPGTDYFFTIMYSRTGADGLTGISAIGFVVDVIPNTPPVLTVPSSFSVEGNTTGGATVSFAVGATDAEDNPDPTPVCSPASGAFFALGTTTVDCTVTDHHGATASGSFDVTVVDTTGPALSGVPGDQAVTTANPSGAVVSYATPTATDVVDQNPTVSCAPSSGSTFPVGQSTVTCTATDATGNHSSGSFTVDVTYDPGITWSVAWGEPIGGTPATLVANQSRNVPVKVEIFANGVEQTSGSASLRVDACGGGFSLTTALGWETSGRWGGHLDTAALRPGCYVATATLDGHDVGSFALDVRGADPVKTTTKAKGPKG
jgi:hypothetical protein